MGLLTVKHLKKKRDVDLSKKQQQLFIYLLADLLANGFTIQDSLCFMEASKMISIKAIVYLRELLNAGYSLMESLEKIGFKSFVISQIELAYVHGDLPDTLKKISHHMSTVEKQKQHLYKMLSYPCLLSLFMMLVIISIRQILLPQLLNTNTINHQNKGILFIQNSPYYFLLVLTITCFMILMIYLLTQRKTSLEKAIFFSQVPICNYFYKKYMTAFFAHEWGKLFSQGLEIKQVIRLMKASDYNLLMRELAIKFEKELMLGNPFHSQVLSTSFFSSELSFIIQQGEMKGYLGKELILYSDLCWKNFFLKIEKSINWLQPAVFLVIALLIVSVYVALLLPIYNGLEEFL